MQRSAGRMFYQWAEKIGKRLEDILDDECLTPEKLVTMPESELKRRQLRVDDDLEDFFDEGVSTAVCSNS